MRWSSYPLATIILFLFLNFFLSSSSYFTSLVNYVLDPFSLACLTVSTHLYCILQLYSCMNPQVF